ncbi:MAG: NUDIX hydrolase [Gemmatimonadetes bacterium]|nr:NUDIX hydrolase [Gemmatimonadota bacterium]
MSSESAFCPSCDGQIPPWRVTADAIVELRDKHGSNLGIVLIERLNPPPGWAIPGGFLDPGEDLEDCARREALEETGLSVELSGLLGVYSAPGRDPRGLTVTAVYVATATGEPVAMDDAKSVMIVDPAKPPTPMAFDHDLILEHYRSWKRGQRDLGDLVGAKSAP